MMRVALCAIVKNEQAYLEEWINYYLKMGIDDIYIYEDLNSLSHAEITDKFERVHLLPVEGYVYGNSGCQRQLSLYNRFLQDYRQEYDWMGFLDVDEFVVIEDGSLKDFLADYTDYEGVCLAWKYYGANGHIKKPDGGVLENYTTQSSGIVCDCQVKTIVNTHMCKKVEYIHAVSHGCVDVFKNYSFEKSLCGLNHAKPENWHIAWINHYFTKSWEEWVQRMKRGNMQNNYRTLDTFFEYNTDMVHLQEKLIMEAMQYKDEFCSTNIYSRKYSLFNDEFVKDMKSKVKDMISKRKQ